MTKTITLTYTIDDEEFEFKERKIIVEKDICCCTETYVALCCREEE